MQQNILDRVTNCLCTALELNDLSLGKKLCRNNCDKWDSLKHYEIIILLEEEFKITFNDEELSECDSAEAICNLVEKKL